MRVKPEAILRVSTTFQSGSLHGLGFRVQGGQGDPVNRSRMGINEVTIWVTGVLSLLTKSP